MQTGHGYKAAYDYVELTVERRDDHWHLSLADTRHGENVEDEEKYATSDEARDAALSLAQHHINVQHNDTLLVDAMISWQTY
jgi:hypothetical protein